MRIGIKIDNNTPFKDIIPKSYRHIITPNKYKKGPNKILESKFHELFDKKMYGMGLKQEGNEMIWVMQRIEFANNFPSTIMYEQQYNNVGTVLYELLEESLKSKINDFNGNLIHLRYQNGIFFSTKEKVDKYSIIVAMNVKKKEYGTCQLQFESSEDDHFHLLQSKLGVTEQVTYCF